MPGQSEKMPDSRIFIFPRFELSFVCLLYKHMARGVYFSGGWILLRSESTPSEWSMGGSGVDARAGVWNKAKYSKAAGLAGVASFGLIPPKPLVSFACSFYTLFPCVCMPHVFGRILDFCRPRVHVLHAFFVSFSEQESSGPLDQIHALKTLQL